MALAWIEKLGIGMRVFGELLEFEFDGYEWDEEKARINEKRHKVAFTEAIPILSGPVFAVAQIEEGEERWLVTGEAGGREITVAFAERNNICRIISVRKASRRERKNYYTHLGSGFG